MLSMSDLLASTFMGLELQDGGLAVVAFRFPSEG